MYYGAIDDPGTSYRDTSEVQDQTPMGVRGLGVVGSGGNLLA